MDIDEQAKSEQLLNRAFRFPKMGIAEKLVAQRLFQATFTHDAKIMIAHVTAASAMVEEFGQEISGLDYERLRGINAVSESFRNVEEIKFPINYTTYGIIYSVPWNFSETEKNYNRFVAPWKVAVSFYEKAIKIHRKRMVKLIHSRKFIFKGCNKNILTVAVDEVDKAQRELIEKAVCPKCNGELLSFNLEREYFDCIIKEPYWSFFFEASNCLTLDGLNSLRGAFENWARTVCMKAVTVMSKLISPRTFDEVAKLMQRKTEQDEAKRE